MIVHPKLAGRSCYHKYEVEPGLFTPGQWSEVNPKLFLDELGIPQSLLGLRALDIGAYDGPFTFELERRGAQVTALDIQDPNVTVFNAVKEIKNSFAEYVRGSVYEASPEALGVYDMVLFAGVYYHLKNPVLALQRIRKLLNDGGLLFIEGASGTDILAQQLKNDLGLPESRMRTITTILDRLPLSYFDFEGRISRPQDQNWWFPTTRCLETILLDSGFRNVAIHNYRHDRLMGRAEANPANSDPGNQNNEHLVLEQDYWIIDRSVAQRDDVVGGTGSRSATAVRRLFRKLPLGLQRTAKRIHRVLRPSS